MSYIMDKNDQNFFKLLHQTYLIEMLIIVIVVIIVFKVIHSVIVYWVVRIAWRCVAILNFP